MTEHLPEPEHISHSVDSVTNWVAQQDPMALERTLQKSLDHHGELMKKGSERSSKDNRDMAEIQEAIMALVRINSRLP